MITANSREMEKKQHKGRVLEMVRRDGASNEVTVEHMKESGMGAFGGRAVQAGDPAGAELLRSTQGPLGPLSWWSGDSRGLLRCGWWLMQGICG